MKELWEFLKLSMLGAIIGLALWTVPGSIKAVYDQYQETRAETSEIDARIMKNRYQLCATYRSVWRYWESRPLLAPYNKPFPPLEEDCRLTWEY